MCAFSTKQKINCFAIIIQKLISKKILLKIGEMQIVLIIENLTLNFCSIKNGL